MCPSAKPLCSCCLSLPARLPAHCQSYPILLEAQRRGVKIHNAGIFATVTALSRKHTFV
eukprot:SAG11_NODE_1960_length_3998_cov_3.835599_3_plen_59_part_00